MWGAHGFFFRIVFFFFTNLRIVLFIFGHLLRIFRFVFFFGRSIRRRRSKKKWYTLFNSSPKIYEACNSFFDVLLFHRPKFQSKCLAHLGVWSDLFYISYFFLITNCVKCDKIFEIIFFHWHWTIYCHFFSVILRFVFLFLVRCGIFWFDNHSVIFIQKADIF